MTATPYEDFLLKVQMPGQYVGGEWNSSAKADARLRVALCFPDQYTVGMSHHGLRVLYEIVNNMEGMAAERSYAPAPDMEAELRRRAIPLRTLESHIPLKQCDIVGFSLQYELCATSVINMLDLGGLPILAAERDDNDPLVIAGGGVSYNPEPYADFIDLFLIGEGEEALPEFLLAYEKLKGDASLSRQEKLRRLVSACPGWYAPALYKADGQGGLTPIAEGVPAKVTRRIVADLEKAPHPQHPVVPMVETAHERVTLEIMRGCPHGCRFCHAGMTGRPRRERSVENLANLARACYANTGYDEIGLLSLSTSDYSHLGELIAKLDLEFSPLGVNLSLPSLRVDAMLAKLPEKLNSVRKGSITIAPEAGTERMRCVINKNISEESLLAGAQAAYQAGWNTIKLYFMIGLPTETDEDVKAIPALARKVALLRGKKGGQPVTLSVSNYVPKAHTPFQWMAMDTPEELKRKQSLIAAAADRRLVNYRSHDIPVSHLEGTFSRGGREMGKVALEAWRRGARLDAWSEHFQPELWQEAFSACNLNSQAIACRKLTPGECLPWGHIEGGVADNFLTRELDKALTGVRTPSCPICLGGKELPLSPEVAEEGKALLPAPACSACGAPGCPKAEKKG